MLQLLNAFGLIGGISSPHSYHSPLTSPCDFLPSAMPTESLEIVRVDGAQIACRRIGTGPPLVVLNGFAATSADWDPLFIDRLASSNQLILPDNRGIGRSTDNGRPFDVAQLAEDTARVIEVLGFERASLLGWSMGGFIAQTLVLQHPSRAC
jgi:pimeloyl-ACP methyl ester carboxylesterase